MHLKFDSHPYFNQNNQTSVGSFRSPSQQRTTASYGPSAGIDMYNPIYDRLDEGSIIEDWIPRDSSGLNQMFSLMYHRCPIGGSVVDIISDLIWSDYELIGVDDPEIKKIYYDTMTNLDILSIMPSLTKEFLVLGRSIDSLIFDSKRGIFTDLISHDQSFVRMTPIPIFGYDPKLDLIASPALKKFAESIDPRDIDARQALPTNYLKAMAGGGSNGVPLDPISTLFLPRRTFNHDYIGTSLYTRLISFWALEKALINATMSAARRRSSPILHVTAGIENAWRPSDAELSEIAGLFMSADQDPVGAVITTRNGVSASEVKSGTDLWKWSDEWSLLTEGKMRALGANDSLLSGEATYTNQDSARSFLMEKSNSLRDTITNKVIYKKIFPLIARLHGFVKSGDIPKGTKPTQRELLSIPESELIMPTIRWKKDLVQPANALKIEMLEKAEEKGVPVTIKNWATACGLNLQDQMSETELDAELRKRIKEYKDAYEQEEFDPTIEAQKKFVEDLRSMTTSNVKKQLKQAGSLSDFPFWNTQGQFCGVSIKDLTPIIKDLDPSSNNIKILFDYQALKKYLIEKMITNEKACVAHYMLYRVGITRIPPVLTKEHESMLTNAIDEFSSYLLTKSLPATKIIEIINPEISIIKSCNKSKKEESFDNLKGTLKKIYDTKDKISTSSSKLWSGI